MRAAAVYSQRKQRLGVGADSKDNKGERNTKKNGTKKSRPVVGGLGGQTYRQTDRGGELGTQHRPGSRAAWETGPETEVGGGVRNPGS